MAMATGPLDEHWAYRREVVPPGSLAARFAAGTAVLESPSPPLDIGAHARGHAVEFAFQPDVEGGPPVVVEYVKVLEDLHGAGDAEAMGPQDREDLGVAHAVAGLMARQEDHQRPVHFSHDATGPAPGLGDNPGRVAGLRGERVRPAGGTTP